MSCLETRSQLLELPIAELRGLAHLKTCAECAALAEALIAAQAELEAELDAYAAEVPAARALEAARLTEDPARSARTRRWWMFDNGLHLGAVAAAAAATLASVVWFSARPEHPAPEDATPSHEASCGDLAAFQGPAMTGALDPDTVACLEGLAAGADPVDPLRLLSVHAWAAGDKVAWAGYAEQLSAATPEDPDLHYKLALHYARTGAEPDRVIDHAEGALDHAEAWPDETHDERVFNAYKLRASAALQLWQADPGDDEARAEAIDFAQEWLDFARDAELDEEPAARLCEAASGAPCD